MSYEIVADGATVKLSGSLNGVAMRWFCAVLYKTVVEREYKDIILDFSEISTVFEAFMLPILPIVKSYNQNHHTDFYLTMPKEESLERLFRNTNWAHFICPRDYPRSNFDDGQHMPAAHFTTQDEQFKVTNDIMEVLLGALEGIERGHLAALEWSVSEITDNVLSHAESEVGGFVQSTVYAGGRKVEVIVADAGIGIPKSMNQGQKQEVALRRSIEEGVTRNKETNRGNGLFGTYRIASLSNGEFEINSQNASLYWKDHEVHVNTVKIPYSGTCVRFVVDCNEPDLLAKALRFKGRPHEPVDYLETKYEKDGTEDLVIKISENSHLLASRQSGKILKNKIRTLLKSCPPGNKVVVDFSDIYVLSSSVADEVFGQLFKELGPMQFMSKIEIANADHTVQDLIDRSIQSRMLDLDQE